MHSSTEQLLARFEAWLNEARAHPGIAEPTAMCLATALSNIPSARIVLLKAYDARGFVFYTNMESQKSKELRANPHAALCFHWMPLGHQVRIQGAVERVSDVEADAYFAARPLMSQIGAWASSQSRPMKHAGDLKQRVEEMKQRFESKPIPRPPHWAGWRVVPRVIEFWQEGSHRLHEREVFTWQADGSWRWERLYP